MRNGEGLCRKDLIRWEEKIREGIINGGQGPLEQEICLEEDAKLDVGKILFSPLWQKVEMEEMRD